MASPFACPKCGSEDFVAEYQEYVAQTCSLDRDLTGAFAPTYTGSMVGDSEAGPDESYRCAECDWTITVGQTVYEALAEPWLEPIEEENNG